MYAVIQDGGRQFTVRKGDKVLCDLKDVEAGSQIRFETVLLIGDDKGARFGTPAIAGAAVTGKVLGEKKGEKLIVFKYRRRKNSKRKHGHRQHYTAVTIESIEG